MAAYRVCVPIKHRIIIRLRRFRSAAAYSSNFSVDDLSVRTYVRTYVRRSVGLSNALWKNGGSDPDAVWHRRLDGSRHEAGSGV